MYGIAHYFSLWWHLRKYFSIVIFGIWQASQRFKLFILSRLYQKLFKKHQPHSEREHTAIVLNTSMSKIIAHPILSTLFLCTATFAMKFTLSIRVVNSNWYIYHSFWYKLYLWPNYGIDLKQLLHHNFRLTTTLL